jgi:hypothetical protein
MSFASQVILFLKDLDDQTCDVNKGEIIVKQEALPAS